jgi:hypothetical protein
MLLETMLDPPKLRQCARGHAESVTVVTLSRGVRALGKERIAKQPDGLAIASLLLPFDD